MNWQRLLTVGGIVAFCLGLFAIVVPGVFSVGLRRYVVALGGLAALWQLFRLARRRFQRHAERTQVPAVADSPPVEPPGQTFEEVFDRYSGAPTGLGVRARLQARIERLVLDTLSLHGTADDARQAVSEGIWTDDPAAVAFLNDADEGPRQFGARVRERVRGRSQFQRRLTRAVSALAALAGIENRPRERQQTERGLGARLGAWLRPDRDVGSWTTSSRESERRPTGNWHGAVAVAMAAVGIGVLTDSPSVLLVGAVAVGYAGYARVSAVAEPQLTVERTVETTTPAPGEQVAVTVTVTNTADSVVPDLRVIDGVPRALSVGSGAVDTGTVLRRGESVTLEYTVTARRGVHEFGPVFTVTRDLAGTTAVVSTVEATTPTTLTCRPRLGSLSELVPLRAHPNRQAGLVETASGGAGTEFFGMRRYERGDPLAWIDWNRFAKTGEFATLQFREERATTVVFVIDATVSSVVGPPDADRPALDSFVAATGTLFDTCLDGGNRVGIAAIGDETAWLAPGTGRSHRGAAREFLATEATLAPGRDGAVPPASWVDRLRHRLPADSQLILLSPLCDDTISDGARRLQACGYPVTVVTLDPTARETNPQRVAAVTRQLRITGLRAGGVPVVEWDWDTSLGTAIADHPRRWG